MKASELRIGNYYSFGFGANEATIRQVNSRFFSSFDDYDFELNGYHNPIPLTEKWLTDFGFEKPNNWHTYSLIISDEDDKKLRSSIQIIIGNGNAQVCRSGINAKSCPCQYVHQLQNLYFALTNEELTLKE